MSASVIARARDDVRQGRPWMARDRLESYVATGSTDTEALELLGEVLFQMGDLPRAARYWMLTPRSDDEFDQARAALRERFPRARLRLDYLLLRGPIDSHPEVVQRRIEALAAEAKREDGRDPTLRSSFPVVTLPPPSLAVRATWFAAFALFGTVLVAGIWWVIEQLVFLIAELVP
jgi:hypothetical protein